ncbi:MAG: hypothetical protein AAFZ65_09910, partial [Planctomycetota bacterium]
MNARIPKTLLATSAATLSALALLGLDASAQLQSTTHPVSPLDNIQLEDTGSTAVVPPLRSIELGRLTDLDDADAVVLDATDLHLVSSLRRFGSSVRLIP